MLGNLDDIYNVCRLSGAIEACVCRINRRWKEMMRRMGISSEKFGKVVKRESFYHGKFIPEPRVYCYLYIALSFPACRVSQLSKVTDFKGWPRQFISFWYFTVKKWFPYTNTTIANKSNDFLPGSTTSLKILFFIFRMILLHRHYSLLCRLKQIKLSNSMVTKQVFKWLLV